MNKKKSIESVSIGTYLAGLIFIISLFGFVLIAHEVVWQKEDWFDTKAFVFFKTHSTPLIIDVFKFFTFFGSTVFLLPAWLLLIGGLFFKGKKANAVDIGILAITSTMLLYGLKPVFGRSRPDQPLFEELTNHSFPSGHALSSLIFCSAIAWLIWKMPMEL